MKKLLYSLMVAALMLTAGQMTAKAQAYKTAAGLMVDIGSPTLVGPQIKHFFSRHNALQASLLFGGSAITINPEYQYNASFGGTAPNLQWYVGMGPYLGFSTISGGGTSFGLSPVAGLDFKIPGAPIDAAFDWRPAIGLNDGADFDAARFGLSLRFTF